MIFETAENSIVNFVINDQKLERCYYWLKNRARLFLPTVSCNEEWLGDLSVRVR